jgi:hypothetical protein
MRSILVVLIITSFVFASIGESYAQTQQNNLAIFVQIKVQDSNGNLVSYLESPRVSITDVAKLNLLLDKNPQIFQKSRMTIGDQKFDVIKANDTMIHQSATIVSQNMISTSDGKQSEVLAIVEHDGYPVVTGDKVTAYWTIIRPTS